ncbi:MAG: YbaN family protein [Elusimicrobiota bacterium]
MYKGLLIFAGVISLGLGVLGMFLPLLPTTPFLLLSASCFGRSSPRLHRWLLSHPWFGSYVENYKDHRAIPLKAKILGLAVLWATMGYSAIFFMDRKVVVAVLLLVGIAVSAHILRLKTLTSKMPGD